MADAFVSITENNRDKNSQWYSKWVFLDLTKPFDTIENETLLKKGWIWILRFSV